eukprot:5753-Pelagomonas_calceolata.AAC.1
MGVNDIQLCPLLATVQLSHQHHPVCPPMPAAPYTRLTQAAAPYWPRPNLPANASRNSVHEEGEETDEGAQVPQPHQAAPSPSNTLQQHQQQQQQQQMDLPSASPRQRPPRPQRTQRRCVQPVRTDTTSSGGSTTEEEEEEEESMESEEWSGAEECMQQRVGKRGSTTAGTKLEEGEGAEGGMARSMHRGAVSAQRAKLRVKKTGSSGVNGRQVGVVAAAAEATDDGRAGSGREREREKEREEVSSGEGEGMDLEGGAEWWEREGGGCVRRSMRGSAKAARVMETGPAGAGASARRNSLGQQSIQLEGESEEGSAVSMARDLQQQKQQQQQQQLGQRRLAVPQVGVVAAVPGSAASIGRGPPAVPPVVQHTASAKPSDSVWALGRPHLQQQQQQQQQQQRQLHFGAGVAAAAVGGSVGSCLPSFGGPLSAAATSVAAAAATAAAPVAPLRAAGPPAGLAIRPIRTSEAQTKQLCGSSGHSTLPQQKGQQAGSPRTQEGELLLSHQHQLLGLPGSDSTPGSSASVLLPSFWEGMGSPKSADLLSSLLSPFSGGAAASALTPLQHFSPRLSPSMLLSPRFSPSLLFSPCSAHLAPTHTSSGGATGALAPAAPPPPTAPPSSFPPAAAQTTQAPSAAATVELRAGKANPAKAPTTPPFHDSTLPSLGQLLDREVMELLQGLSPTYRPLSSPFSSGWAGSAQANHAPPPDPRSSSAHLPLHPL